MLTLSSGKHYYRPAAVCRGFAALTEEALAWAGRVALSWTQRGGGVMNHVVNPRQVRGSGRKYGTSFSGWQQQLVSRIGVPDTAPTPATRGIVGAAR